MKKPFNLMVTAAVVVAAVSVASVASVALGAATRNEKSEIARNLGIFNAVYKELQTNYVDTIDAEKSVATAINAMLADIDPYTEYIPEKERDDFKVIATGEYGGIGSYISARNDGVIITEPYEGSPAHLAGLRAGDLITAIDGDTVLSLPVGEVSKRLKGRAGTNVRISVRRPYVEDSVKTFDITRRKIQVPDVPYYGVVAGNVGYIYLTTFNDNSEDDVRNALKELKKDGKINSLILDLRGNGGGLLESAVRILSFFLPKNTEVLRTRGRGLFNERVYRTTSAPIDEDIPMVVMIDYGTASAAEIVAGALQDLDRAVIVGRRSYGKGLVQSTRPLPSNGLLKVTHAKYYIPSGRLIQAIDYSHRNTDGSVERIPDSLTTVFHTAAGREVRDGGGITPDLALTYPDANRLTYNIQNDHWAFDYATRFAAREPSIASPERFVLTDSIYDDFKRFIDPERFKYDKVCEKRLADLREAAKVEGYMTDSVAAIFSQLETLLRHDLDHDLDVNKKEICELLTEEIVTRYYFYRGKIIASLRTDEWVDSAAALLKDRPRYRQTLRPQR